MYIIPYFLENEAKKLLKVKLSEFINDVTNDLLDNIFRYNSDNNQEVSTIKKNNYLFLFLTFILLIYKL